VAKECYFNRLLVDIFPNHPLFKETQWFVTEDVNVEHLLDVFTSVDANSDDIWDVCVGLMRHLFNHKPRLTVLEPKIRGLPDDHHYKPNCLFWLAQLFYTVGNYAECKQLLVHSLELGRAKGCVYIISRALIVLAATNNWLGLYKEGIEQAEEALGIYKQTNHIPSQVLAYQQLSLLFHGNKQLDSAEEAALKAISLLPDEDSPLEVCQCKQVLATIYCSKGMREIGTNYFRAALEIASTFNLHNRLYWIYICLARLLFDQGRFDDAHTHFEHAKLHVVNDMYSLGHVTQLQAQLLCHQHRFEEAKTEALHALSMFEKVGAMDCLEECRTLIDNILHLMGQEVMVSSSKLWCSLCAH